MEPVGLAVGVIGLAGLFNTCLDIINKVQLYRSSSADAQDLAAQFTAYRLRFERWGHYVGFNHSGLLQNNHHPALDDHRIFLAIGGLLNIVARTFDEDEQQQQQQQQQQNASYDRLLSGGRSRAAAGVDLARSQVHARWQKVAWAVRGKAERIEKVAQLGTVVQQLHDLIPVENDFSFQSANMAAAAAPPIQGYLLGDQHDIMQLREAMSRFEQESKADLRKELFTWIMGDMSASDGFEDSLHRKLDDTCNWIFDRPEYLAWESNEFEYGSPKFLWINGPAGFGKTILCSHITKHLLSLSETQTTSTAHFFLSASFGSHDDPYIILRSWISQVVASSDVAFRLSMDVFRDQQSKTASRTNCLGLLTKIVQALPRCTLVVDGLDECLSSAADFLSNLRKALAGSATRVLIVSRDQVHIREALTLNDTKTGHISLSKYRLNAVDTEADIALYSRSIVDGKLSNKASAIRDDISDTMARRCEGQFLWLKLQGDGLRRGMNKKQLQNVVHETPIGLDHVYMKNWEKVNALAEGVRDRALSLLRWTTFAFRPLTVSEISEAVLIDIENGDDELPLDLDELPDTIDQDYIDTEIVGLCFSLLEVHPGVPGEGDLVPAAPTIHVTHFSVREFLLPYIALTNVPRGVPNAAETRTRAVVASGQASVHAILAEYCLYYIKYPRIWQEADRTRPADQAENGTELQIGDFRDYAVGFWHRHYRLSANVGDDPAHVTDMFDRAHPVWDQWTEWGDRERGYESEWIKEEKAVLGPGPLYYASLFGLHGIVQRLLDRGAGANEASGKGRRPMTATCRSGHTDIVRTLLAAGAKVDVVSDFGSTPLHFAVFGESIDVVKLLLEQGADPSVENEVGRTPLIGACISGHVDIARAILEAGGDAHQLNADGRNAVHFAASNEQVHVLALLLSLGVDITVGDKRQIQALDVACLAGSEEAVKLLITHGADVNATNVDGRTTLHMASSKGHAGIVRCLLDAGAVIDAVDSRHYTPLMDACDEGNLDAVKLLIEAGADPLAVFSKWGKNAFHIALSWGHCEVAGLLLENGVNVDCRTADDDTALHLTALKTDTAAAQFLISHGAHIDARDSLDQTPLHCAVWYKHVELVSLLIDAGARTDCIDEDGDVPLHMASRAGTIDIVNLLLDKGVDGQVDAIMTPLQIASLEGHVEMVKLLLDRGAWLEAQDADGDSALTIAAQQGNLEVVDHLLDRGADIDHKASNGWTSLHYAMAGGHWKLAKMLLERGADLDSRIKSGERPLQPAMAAGSFAAAEAEVSAEAAAAAADYLDLATQEPISSSQQLVRNSTLGILTHSNGDKLVRKDKSLIHWMVIEGNLEAIRILARLGENLDAVTGKEGFTPLLLAMWHNQTEAARLLIELGACIDGATSKVPLLYAAEEGKQELVRVLLEGGADAEVRDVMGRNALHFASEAGHLAVVRRMCEYKLANPDASGIAPGCQDGNHRSELFLAAQFGHDETVSYLCDDPRVDLTKEDFFGNTALAAAAANRQAKVVEVLLSRCRTWTAKQGGSDVGRAMLLWKRATAGGDIEVMRLVSDYLREQHPGLDLEGEGVEPAVGVGTANKNQDYCDACTLCIPQGVWGWSCNKCDGGHFVICSTCFQSGLRCRNTDHRLRVSTA